MCMTHFKNKSAFGLLEVLFALVVFGIVTAPLFVLYGDVFRSVVKLSDRAEHMIMAQQLLMTARREQAPTDKTFTASKRDAAQGIVIEYQLAQIEKMPEFKDFPGLCKETLTITWNEVGVQKRDELVTFLFKPALIEPAS